MPRLDDVLDREPVTLNEIETHLVIERIAVLGNQLRKHEQFTSMLGVGDVVITRLPNSIYLQIFWNDSDDEDVAIYIKPDRRNTETMIMALTKYLHKQLAEE